VAFSPDGSRVAAGAADGTIRIWDGLLDRTASDSPRLVLKGHRGTVSEVAFSSDGRRLASLSWDKTVRVWDAAGGCCLEVIDGIGDGTAIALGPDRFPWRAVTRGWETVIEAGATGEPIAHLLASLYHIATHPNGRRWAGTSGNYLALFTLEGDA
jgi:WD40 repeat protein